MKTTAVSVFEYLHTEYSPGVDYLDGVLEERNVGEFDHARLQGLIVSYLMGREKIWGVLVLPEQRVQISPTRFRIPDITVIATRPVGGIVTEPPLLCVEILSPEDTRKKMQSRIDDYLRFGVPCVWEIDPEERRAWMWTSDGPREAKDGVLIAGSLRLPLAEIGR